MQVCPCDLKGEVHQNPYIKITLRKVNNYNDITDAALCIITFPNIKSQFHETTKMYKISRGPIHILC